MRFTSTTFQGFVRSMGMNSVGNLVVTIETMFADRHRVFALSDVQGDDLHFTVTGKVG